MCYLRTLYQLNKVLHHSRFTLQEGTFAGGTLENGLKYTTNGVDHTFSCVLDMYGNTLFSAALVVDIFTWGK